MKGKWLLLGSALMIAAVLTVWSAPVQATVFGFTDEYYVNTQTEFNTLFGTGTAGYNGTGVYQEVNTATPTVYELYSISTLSSKTGTAYIPGEFIQNSNTGSGYTGITISPSSWGAYFYTTSENGTSVMSPARDTNPGFPYFVNEGSTATIQYQTGITTAGMSGGTAAPFNLNNIDLSTTYSGTATGYTITGYLGGVQKYQITAQTGFQENGVGAGYIYGLTMPFDWTDIDTVTFTSMGPAGTLQMDNIDITPYSASAVPIPPSALLLGTGLLGMVGLGWRSRKLKA